LLRSSQKLGGDHVAHGILLAVGNADHVPGHLGVKDPDG